MASNVQISAAWLAEHTDLRVDAVQCTHVGRFSTDVYRLRCKGEGVPGALVLKRGGGASLRIGESFELEARSYAELAPALPVRLPQCYGAGTDWILLEDVDQTPFSWQEGPSEAHLAQAIAALRRLHGCAAPSWVPAFGDARFADALGERCERGWQRHRQALLALCPTFERLPPLSAALVSGNYRQLAGTSLLHGDAHLENLPLDSRGALVALDWQGPRRGEGLLDLAYFLIMSYPTAKRRAVEAGALEAYLGREPTLLDRQRYARGALARACAIIELAADRSPSALNSESFRWVIRRCLQGAADHAGELPEG